MESSSTILFLSMVWSIWRLRNEMIFAGKVFSIDFFFNIQASAACVAMEAENVTTTRATGGYGRLHYDPWDTSRSDIANNIPYFVVGDKGSCQSFRAKVDACWETSLHASLGWVVYSPTGECFRTFARSFTAESAIQAEAFGIRDLIKWAMGANIRHLDISSDCLQVVLQLAQVEVPHHLTKGLLQDIESCFTSFHCICFSFLPRRLNKVAHNLAKVEMRL
ncbi:uncharacterized protein LOC141651419 [Silene latifolia]|uniref:uncharacterized protein LOC141651419 n=1 Tax=Silene latifolia TaxID=37657 RepID=UPI003D7846F1